MVPLGSQQAIGTGQVIGSAIRSVQPWQEIYNPIYKPYITEDIDGYCLYISNYLLA